jgi:hypothetical protein
MTIDVSEQEPKTHDYSRPSWGHDYSTVAVIDGGRRLRLGGWGHGISPGDYLILRNWGDTTRYRVETIEYCENPRDMWFANVAFAPRPRKEEKQ